MAKPDISRILTGTSALLRVVWRTVRLTVPRAYALLLILLIGWLTLRAVRYLTTSLVRPSAAPAQITGLPLRLDGAFLKTERTAWQAVDATEHPRTPLAHYHRIDSWIRPDRYNDCARSGCHNPLPHTRRKETRAFLNMHATSIHCGVCHLKTGGTPLPLTWYDLDDGKRRNPPTLLQAYGYLTATENAASLKSPDEGVQRTIVDLLREAATEANGLPSLDKLADHFTRVRPRSDAFEHLVESARGSLARHFRGEYGAKLVLYDPKTGEQILGHPGTEDAVEDYLDRADSIAGRERAALLDEIHPLRRDKPLKCPECHRSKGGRIDFAGAGYPPPRVNSLVNPIVVRMIEHIDSGTPFHMPDFVAPDAPAPTAPAPRS